MSSGLTRNGGFRRRPENHGKQLNHTHHRTTRAKETAGMIKGAYSPFIWYLAQSIRQANAERCLDDCRSDCDAPDSPEGADEVGSRGGDGVI